MQPGAWSEEGFLAPGWSLADVLSEDLRALESLGVQQGAVADALQELIGSGRGSDWERPARTGDHTVEILRIRGFITCPWASQQFQPCAHGYGGRPTANRFRIVHLPTNAVLQGFELSSHMIGAHGFFGGPRSVFRLEPGDVVHLLGLPGRRDG